MKRSTRKELAKQTVEIVERGSYQSATGREIDISASVRACHEATQFFPPDVLEGLRQEVLGRPAEGFVTGFGLFNETTLAGITRELADKKGPIAVLNFASAKNPGGGFLNGSQAQEESLAGARPCTLRSFVHGSSTRDIVHHLPCSTPTR